MGRNMFLLLLLLLVHLPSLSGNTVNAIITNDSRKSIRLQEFYFSKTGRVSISLTNVQTVSDEPINPSNMGFYLLKRRSEANDVCVPGSPYLSNQRSSIASLNQLSPPPFSTLNITVIVPESGRHGIYFINCERETAVSMDIELHLYNMGEDGQRSYLPNLATHLPLVLDFFSAFYFEIITLWAVICITNILHMQRIHWLMSLLFVAKYLSLTSQAENKRFENLTGTSHQYWDIVFYTFHSSHVLLLGIVLMLIAYRWSKEKPFLQGKEIVAFCVGITIHLFDIFCYLNINKTGPYVPGHLLRYWGSLIFHLFSGFWPLLPFMWSLKTLKRSANKDGDAVRVLRKMRSLMKMFVLVLLYQVFSKNSYLKNQYCALELCNDSMVVEYHEFFTAIFYLVMVCLMQPGEEVEDELWGLNAQLNEQRALRYINGDEFSWI